MPATYSLSFNFDDATAAIALGRDGVPITSNPSRPSIESTTSKVSNFVQDSIDGNAKRYQNVREVVTSDGTKVRHVSSLVLFDDATNPTPLTRRLLVDFKLIYLPETSMWYVQPLSTQGTNFVGADINVNMSLPNQHILTYEFMA